MGVPEASFVDRALEYARGVRAGQIVACKWVRRACERQLDDLDRWQGQPGAPYYFDLDEADRICRFVELFEHIKGKWARKRERIRLEPWQIFILTTVFGWKRSSDGLRRFRTAYNEVARKNAKSTLSSVVGLYMLTLDGEPGAEVYSAATTRDQAAIVWSVSAQMAKRSPSFRKAFGVDVGSTNISVLETASKFEALSSEAGNLDGLNIHCGIVDELHAHRTRDVWDVIETATGSREQPLIWTITTAGTDRTGICYEIRSYGTKVLDRVVTDETFFAIIYTIDDDDDPYTEIAWRKANPNFGVSVFPDDLERKAAKARSMPSALNNFLTKHCDVWVNANTAWLDVRQWDACREEGLTIERFAGKRCIAALDLASKTDIAALVLLFEETRGAHKHYSVFGRFYLPEDTVEDSDNAAYSGWVREGRLITTPGNILDFDAIADDLRSLKKKFQFVEVAYDPFQATQFAVQLAGEGFPMVEVGMTVKQLSEPMKHTGAMIIARRLHHDGDPVLSWMLSNVVAHEDAKENIFPRKDTREAKIDGAVALFIAMNRAILGDSRPKVGVWSLG